MNALSKANVILGLGVVLAAGALFWSTGKFQGEKLDLLFPQLLLILMGIVGLVLIATEAWNSKRSGERPTSFRLSRKQVLILVVSSIYPIAAFGLGFYTATFLFLTFVPWVILNTPSGARPDQRGAAWKSLLRDAAYAGLLVLFLYLSFWVFLRLSFPQGVLI